MGGGGQKIPYPKHIWSPAGGWYTQPANWRMNTAVIGATCIGITALVWNLSNRLQRQVALDEEQYQRFRAKQLEGK